MYALAYNVGSNIWDLRSGLCKVIYAYMYIRLQEKSYEVALYKKKEDG